MNARETRTRPSDRLPLDAGVAQWVERQPSNVTERCAESSTERTIFRIPMRNIGHRANRRERAETARNRAMAATCLPGAAA